MRREFTAIGAVVVASTLAACSSSAGVTPPLPGPLPTPVPALHYAGRIVQTYTYKYGYPSQEPPTTIVTRVTSSVTSVSAPNYPAGTLDIRSQTVDKTSLQSTHSTTDAYMNQTPSSVLLYATNTKIEAASGGQSSLTKTAYKTPQIVTKTTGAWTNSPAATVDESYSDGHYQDRTIGTAGTYEEKGTTLALNGQVAPITLEEESSGAGRYTGPFDGCPPQTSWIFTAAPTITLTLSTNPPSAGCEEAPTRIPTWYPASPTLFSERDAAQNNVAVPTQCSGLSEKRAHVTTRSVTGLDTIIGYVERTQMIIVSSQDSGTLLCVLLSDRIANYYNWQGDTPYFFLFSANGKPISTIDTQERLTMQTTDTQHALGLGARDADAVATGAEVHFMARVERVREQLHDAMIKHLEKKRLSAGGTL